MKPGDIVTLDEIRIWLNKQYEELWSARVLEHRKDRALWYKNKEKLRNNTKFKVIKLPDVSKLK